MAVVALVAAVAASANPTTYSLTASKSCLTKKGATFEPTTPGAPRYGLTTAQDSETLVSTLPNGSTPAFLYLAIAPTGAQAQAILNVVRKSMTPNPTSSNSWSGTQGNAAWTVLTLSTKPSASVHALVLSCLIPGAAPTGAAPSPQAYSMTDVSTCLAARGEGTMPGSVLAKASAYTFGHPLPASLVPHVLFAVTATTPNGADGLGVLLLFGANATALRTQLEQALHLATPGLWEGAKKNAAWYAYGLPHATAKGIAAGKAAVLACLP
jgi:hypothetical protein